MFSHQTCIFLSQFLLTLSSAAKLARECLKTPTLKTEEEKLRTNNRRQTTIDTVREAQTTTTTTITSEQSITLFSFHWFVQILIQ